ncbi:MAG: tryptophan--tRNA ligase, partial [Demequinaceae bacterium]|nr:tryptophan--tRNA ligase [Demequinaceae bacterium]
GPTVTVPQAFFVKETAKIFDLQDPTAKMSKSGSPQGIIELLDDPKVVAKRIKSAVTDTDRDIRFDPKSKPGVSNLLTIFSALSGRPVDNIVEEYRGKGYGDLKGDLAEVVVAYLTPIRESTLEWMESKDRLDSVLGDGAARASAIAQSTLERVYDRVGLLARHR